MYKIDHGCKAEVAVVKSRNGIDEGKESPRNLFSEVTREEAWNVVGWDIKSGVSLQRAYLHEHENNMEL